MSNWYKKALRINTLTDRNILNDKIKSLDSFMKIMKYFAKYVLQNAKDVKNKTERIAKEDVISSYPNIKKYLVYIAAKALDNPKESSMYCDAVVVEIGNVIKKLRIEREDFTNNLLPRLTKKRNKK